jgi:hypothetical protein
LLKSELRISRHETTSVGILTKAIRLDECGSLWVTSDVFSDVLERRPFAFFFPEHTIVGLLLQWTYAWPR